MTALQPDVHLALTAALPRAGLSPAAIDWLEADPMAEHLALVDGPGSDEEDRPVAELFNRVGIPTIYAHTLTDITAMGGIPEWPHAHHLHLNEAEPTA
jgi:hypothetical protein